MRIQAGQVAVVTGAASGIGRALAEQLLQKGCKVALVDWNEEGLAETAKALQGEVIVRRLDVADAPAFTEFAQDVLTQWGHVDLLVNNAGVTVLQRAIDAHIPDVQWVLNVNFWGVVHGTQAFLPGMVARKSGAIVNISSLYGMMGWPSQTAYCASKFAVRGYTEALRHELHGSGVSAHCVHPGGIDTAIVKSARFTSDDRGRTDRSIVENDFKRVARTSPAKAATIILRGVESGRERILVGFDAKLLVFLTRLMPERYFGVIRVLERFFRQ